MKNKVDFVLGCSVSQQPHTQGWAGAAWEPKAQPCGPKSLTEQGLTCKDTFSSQHFHQAPFHLGSFHVSRREAAGRILFISDKLRSDHPFRVLQDGNFWKGGGVAAQLEHPLGYSHAGSSTLGSAADPAKTPKSSPVPCPVQPGGSRAFVGAAATGLGGCSGTAGRVLPRLSS